jgi:hypothetical protein
MDQPGTTRPHGQDVPPWRPHVTTVERAVGGERGTGGAVRTEIGSP